MFRAAAILCLLVASGSAAPQKSLRSHGRIVGGERADIKQFPFLVSLELFGLHNCGGSLIAPDKVLTAAHCIEGLLTYLYTVVAGTSNLSNEGVRIGVKSYKAHEGYRDYSNDVAIITLNEPFPLSDSIQTIEIAEEELPAYTAVNVTGWGLLDPGDLLTPSDLYNVEVNIVDRGQCGTNYANVEDAYIDTTMICAGVPEGGKDACSGDSGSALTKDGVQYGVVSWGLSCALPGYPGVYSNVAELNAWIKQNL